MWCEHMVRSLYNSTNTALILIPLMLCVPAVIVIRNSDTFDNNFGKEEYFTKYFKTLVVNGLINISPSNIFP